VKTDEQHAAFVHLRALAEPSRFRIATESEGWPVTPGGQIEWYDGGDLAVWTNRPRRFDKLWAIPGVRRHQTGDREMRRPSSRPRP
jgi:hypothetical protein